MANKQLKIFILAAICFFIARKSFAQDILYMEGGGKLECQISEIEDSRVKYKMWQNRRGPDYIVPKERLVLLFYQNGDYVVFDQAEANGMRRFSAIEGNQDVILTKSGQMLKGSDAKTNSFSVKIQVNNVEKSLSLNDVLLILYHDGKHELPGNPSDVAHMLVYNNPMEKPQAAEDLNPAPLLPEDTSMETEVAEDILPLPETNKTPETTNKESITGTNTYADKPDNSGSELSDIDMKEFRAKALDKTRNLGQYFSIIADKSTNWQDANDAIDLAVTLFVNEEARVEVSSVNTSEKRQYPIRNYLERLKLLKYDRIEITWSDIVYVSNLKKGVDGNYYGIITFVQKFTGFRDGQEVYSDYTRKNIEIVLKGYTKQVGGQTHELWDVFLSDIGVVNTRRG